jgi:hypothetical protein
LISQVIELLGFAVVSRNVSGLCLGGSFAIEPGALAALNVRSCASIRAETASKSRCLRIKVICAHFSYFEIVLRRLSENAPDLEFRKQFIWSVPSSVWQASPSVGVGLAFAADEAVEQYRIENITPCVCRN